MSDITVELCDVNSFLIDDWAALQAMEIGAYTSGGFSPEEANALLYGDDYPRYINVRKNPQTEVGVSLPDRLQVYEPRLIVASRNRRPVGSLAVATTVSGNPFMRPLKRRFSPDHNYIWIKSLAVASEERGNAVAAKMGTCLFRHMRGKLQNPVVAYVYPERTPGVSRYLLEHSFDVTNVGRVPIIEGGEELMLQRFKSPRLADAAVALGIVS